jgi:undecaprenyl diphosphate synthase
VKIPTHVAIILDGNGRWAKSKGMPRNYGHTQGAKNVEVICEAAWNMGVKYLTVYAFSTENWNRPEHEVAALMKLMRWYFKNYLKKAMKNNMRVRIIGDKNGLAPDIQKEVENLEKTTADNDGLNFQIAVNYGSRDEIIRAVKRIIADCEAGELKAEQLDEKAFTSYLDTGEIPAPDLLIRTGGDERISNYLLWQSAYSEFYFTPIPWPDFSSEEIKKAIQEYTNRDRRYGGVKEE